MFCPGCGNEENGPNQYCRRCGSDLGLIRAALEGPNPTAGAGRSRDEVGLALAAKIREVHSAKELTRVTNWVLPKIEKFLESPEERRLRRIRAGTITASVGTGVAIAFSILGLISKENLFLLLGGIGVVVFFVGFGVLINGLLSSLPKTDQRTILPTPSVPPLADTTNDLVLPRPAAALFTSVTEHTTTHLEEKPDRPESD